MVYDLAADLRALDELQERVDAAIVGADVETYVSLLAADAVLMPPDAEQVIGPDAIREWSLQNARAARFLSYEATTDEVVVAGDWAFRRAWATWTLGLAVGGAPISSTGKFIIVYRRQANGGWKVARDIWNGSPDPPPASGN